MIIEWVYLIILIAAVLSNFVLMSLSWSRRQSPSANWFVLLQLVLTLLSFSYFMVAINENQSVIYFWLRVRYSLLNLSIFTFFCTALSFTENAKWLHPRYLILNLIIPCITIVVVWFAPALFWQSWEITHSIVVNVEAQQFAGWFAVYATHGYILLLLGTILLLRYALTSTSISQRQSVTLASGVLVVIILSLLPTLGLTSNLPNPIPISLSILSLFIFWALIKHGLLQMSSARYHSIIEHMQDKVIVLDSQNRVVLFNKNAKRLLNAHPEIDVIGKHLSEVFVEDKALIEQHINTWEARFELSMDVDNLPAILDVRISPILNEQGQQKYKLIVLRDITLRKQAQQREFELQLELERIHLLTNFIQNSAHEFKTPLAIIGANSYLLVRSEDIDKRQEKAAVIKQQIDRIMKLVDAQLLLAKIENAQFSSTTPVNMALLVKGVGAKMQAKNDNTPLLEYEMDATPCTVKGNQEYLALAMEQVLDNAYRYTPKDGVIKICTWQADHTVHVEISDSGPGISEDKIPHIFETFWRDDYSHTTPGMGLGLSIAKRIVEAHKGEITADSFPGQGTRVRMVFGAS